MSSAFSSPILFAPIFISLHQSYFLFLSLSFSPCIPLSGYFSLGKLDSTNQLLLHVTRFFRQWEWILEYNSSLNPFSMHDHGPRFIKVYLILKHNERCFFRLWMYERQCSNNCLWLVYFNGFAISMKQMDLYMSFIPHMHNKVIAIK